jgi:hypothetical protein
MGCKDENFDKPTLTPGCEFLKQVYNAFKLHNSNFCLRILTLLTLIEMQFFFSQALLYSITVRENFCNFNSNFSKSMNLEILPSTLFKISASGNQETALKLTFSEMLRIFVFTAFSIPSFCL